MIHRSTRPLLGWAVEARREFVSLALPVAVAIVSYYRPEIGDGGACAEEYGLASAFLGRAGEAWHHSIRFRGLELGLGEVEFGREGL